MANEELYDWSSDPGSWHNLAKDPEYADVLKGSKERAPSMDEIFR